MARVAEEFPLESPGCSGDIRLVAFITEPGLQPLNCAGIALDLDAIHPGWFNRCMTEKQFFDWQTSGGTDDVMRLVDCLERADVSWCCIGGVAVNHWAEEQMVTRDVDLVIALDDVDRAVAILEQAGFRSERFDWSINLRGRSAVTIQLSTEGFYREFPGRAVPADVHGILLRVASLEDTLAGKIKAWSEPTRRQSKQAKDFTDIVRLVEAHPRLWAHLPPDLQALVKRPADAR